MDVCERLSAPVEVDPDAKGLPSNSQRAELARAGLFSHPLEDLMAPDEDAMCRVCWGDNDEGMLVARVVPCLI